MGFATYPNRKGKRNLNRKGSPMEIPQGWQEEQTGGGCTAWSRNLDPAHYALLTNGDAQTPTDGEPIYAGVYRMDGSEVASADFLHLALALAWVEAVNADLPAWDGVE